MAKLNKIINPQAFELIRDRIAAILYDEFLNQYTLTYDPDLAKISFEIEAINPEDKTDLPVINVSLGGGKWNEFKEYNGEIQGDYIYYIDIYTDASSTDLAQGETIAARLLQKLIGLCRAILEAPVYKTLDYTPGFIKRVGCKDLLIKDKARNDSLNSQMARLIFSVEVFEKDQVQDGILLQQSNTKVVVNNTNDGYTFIVNP